MTDPTPTNSASVNGAVRPTFLVIGAPKAATTALCANLAKHPQVAFSRPKETLFFSHDEVWRKGWGWYESTFGDVSGKTAIGDGTTHYASSATFPNGPARIIEHLPDVKLIYIVRDPLKRIESYWMELTSQGLMTEPFNESVRKYEELRDTSRYWKHYQLYREHYGEDRILLLFYEDWVRDAAGVLTRCFEHIGVDPAVTIDDAQEAKWVSAGNKRRDTAVMNLLRRSVPGFYKLRDAVPPGVRDFMSKHFKKPIEGRPEWDESTRRWVLDDLRDDALKFLAHCGKPADLWRLDP